MSENDLRSYLFAGIGRNAHMCRVESPLVSQGFPDVNYCSCGVSNEMELKYGKWPGSPPDIRPSQMAWFRERMLNGGFPLLLARGEFAPGLMSHWLYGGDVIEKLYTAKSVPEWASLAFVDLGSEINFPRLLLLMQNPQHVYQRRP